VRRFNGVPLDVIADLENPDYESIIKATIKHSDAVIASEGLSPSLTKFIESSGTFLPFVPKDEFAEAYTNFIKTRFYQFLLLSNMYNNSFKKILLVACVVFILVIKTIIQLEMV
jgi:hypothetical protein